MSIQWNKEVKMKDVKKFLNQEISLGEIDYHKCLQVSLMVVAFGIIPAFTYGTVLGTLEGQRVALMGEVSSLKAEVLSAKSSLSSVSYFKARLSAASPVERIITTSDSSVTKDVVLGVIEITASSTKRVLDRVTVLFTDNAPVGTNQYYRNIRLIGANKTYTPDKVTKGYAVFTDVAVAYTGEWSQFVLKTDIAPQNQFKNGTVATTTFVVEQSKIVASNVKFLQSGVVVSNTSSEITPFDNGANAPYRYSVKMKYTINNQGSNDIYVSKYSNLAMATSSTLNYKTAMYAIRYVSNTPTTVAGDTSAVYVIPSGTARNFSVESLLDSRGSIGGLHEFKFTKLFYSNNPNIVSTTSIKFIDTGLENLRAMVTVSGDSAVILNTSAYFVPIDNGYNTPYQASVTMSFKFMNTTPKDLYISKQPGASFATSSTITKAASSTLTLIQATPSTVAGDTAVAYVIPSGTARTFQVYGVVNNKNGVAGAQEFKITKVFYSDTLTNLKKSYIDFGIEWLRVSLVI